MSWRGRVGLIRLANGPANWMSRALTYSCAKMCELISSIPGTLHSALIISCVDAVNSTILCWTKLGCRGWATSAKSTTAPQRDEVAQHEAQVVHEHLCDRPYCPRYCAGLYSRLDSYRFRRLRISRTVTLAHHLHPHTTAVKRPGAAKSARTAFCGVHPLVGCARHGAERELYPALCPLIQDPDCFLPKRMLVAGGENLHADTVFIEGSCTSGTAGAKGRKYYPIHPARRATSSPVRVKIERDALRTLRLDIISTLISKKSPHLQRSHIFAEVIIITNFSPSLTVASRLDRDKSI